MLSHVQLLSSLLYLAAAYVILSYNYKDRDSRGGKWKALISKLVIILALGAVKLGYDYQSLSPSYYSTLEVGRQSNTLEIRRAYKQLSKKYHPDKNPDSLHTEEKFQSIKEAYDVLMDEAQRDIYNRFGTNFLEFDPRKDEMKLIADTGVVYLFWIVVGYIMTLPRSARACRPWLGILGVALLAAEVCFQLTETALPEWTQYSLTEYELLFILQSFFPCLVASLRCLAEYLYVDVDMTSIAVLKEVHNHQKGMADMLQQLLVLVEAQTASGPGHAPAESVGAHPDAAAQLQVLRSKILELHDQMDRASDSAALYVDALKKCSANPGAQYYWIIFVLMYGSVYFLQ